MVDVRVSMIYIFKHTCLLFIYVHVALLYGSVGLSQNIPRSEVIFLSGFSGVLSIPYFFAAHHYICTSHTGRTVYCQDRKAGVDLPKIHC